MVECVLVDVLRFELELDTAGDGLDGESCSTCCCRKALSEVGVDGAKRVEELPLVRPLFADAFFLEVED